MITTTTTVDHCRFWNHRHLITLLYFHTITWQQDVSMHTSRINTLIRTYLVFKRVYEFKDSMHLCIFKCIQICFKVRMKTSLDFLVELGELTKGGKVNSKQAEISVKNMFEINGKKCQQNFLGPRMFSFQIWKNMWGYFCFSPRMQKFKHTV